MKTEIEEKPTSAIAEYSSTVAVLARLNKDYKDAKYDVATPKGMAEALKARAEVRTYRIGLEKERVKIKAAVLERGRLIDSEAKRITAELEALETPIDDQIKAEENRKEAERLAKIEVERLRVERIQRDIDDIRNIHLTMRGKKSEEIEETLEICRKGIVAEKFQEFAPVATVAAQEAIANLETLYKEVKEQEDEKARIIAERAELERLRKEQAEREAAAAKKHAEEEAKLKAQREAEEAKIKAEREAEEKRIAEARKVEEKRIADERAKAEAQLAIERKAEQEKREAEEKKQRLERESHEAKMKVEREEAERVRIEAEKRQAEIDRQKAELEQQRLQAEEQAKKAAAHIESLRQAKRANAETALADILALAKDEAGHPNAHIVRREIAIIAEANITQVAAEEPVKKKTRKAKEPVTV